MAKGPDLNDVTNILNGASTINDNNDAIQTSFENTLSRDGSTPNAMEADLDMNGNDLLNINDLSVDSLTLSGNRVTDINAYIPQWRSDWVTDTEYNTYDLVKQSGDSYICLTPHTSDNFSADLAADRWEVFVEQGDSGAGSGDMLAANNLSDVSDAATSRTNLGLEIGTNVQAQDSTLQSFADNDPFALKSITTLSSAGSGTYTLPTGCRAIRVRVQGAGGGGGGAGAAGGSGRASVAGGGGYGGFVESFISSPAASYSYTVGAAGTGGAAGVNVGVDGGDSTFSDGGSLSITAGGGAGGAGSGSTASNTQNLGGLGGTATGGDLNIPGDPGECGLIVGGDISNLGRGASGPLGSPGRQTLSADGGDASGYGAAGGGGSGQDNNTARAGGDGVGGLITIEEYY